MKASKLIGLVFLIIILIIPFAGCSGNRATYDFVKVKETGATGETLTFLEDSDKDTEAENAAEVSEFILGPGDELEITVYRKEDLNRNIKIDMSGKIMFPLVGDIQAAGLSVFQVRDKLRESLSKYIIDPQISVGVLSVQSQKIIVLGEVNNPGFFQGETAMSALEAISRAGGFTLDGEKKTVLLIRGGMKNPQLRALNLDLALKEGALAQNIMLRGGDIMYVPRTYISNVDRFFEHLSTIINPIVQMERGYLLGDEIITGENRSVRTR